VGLALGWACGSAVAAPKAELQPYWDRSDEANPAAIDHSPWQGLLDAYLDTHHPSGVHRFAYAAVRSADRAVLRAYLAALQALDPRRYSRPEQEAYWINLYNALTVDLVLAHYPVKSIREIGGGWLRRGPWDDAIARVAGRALSLNDIEHGSCGPSGAIRESTTRSTVLASAVPIWRGGPTRGITWSGCSKRAPATTSTTRAAPYGRMASFAPPVSTTGIRKTSAGRRPGYWAISCAMPGRSWPSACGAMRGRSTMTTTGR
jgi:hypothetical protein